MALASTLQVKVIFDSNLGIVCPGETEEEFSTRLAKNLEDLIIKEGPETVNIQLKLPSLCIEDNVGISI